MQEYSARKRKEGEDSRLPLSHYRSSFHPLCLPFLKKEKEKRTLSLLLQLLRKAKRKDAFFLAAFSLSSVITCVPFHFPKRKNVSPFRQNERGESSFPLPAFSFKEKKKKGNAFLRRNERRREKECPPFLNPADEKKEKAERKKTEERGRIPFLLKQGGQGKKKKEKERQAFPVFSSLPLRRMRRDDDLSSFLIQRKKRNKNKGG